MMQRMINMTKGFTCMLLNKPKNLYAMVLIFFQANLVNLTPNKPVFLHSTLKQGSLCPGDQVVTFTCGAIGRDLIWIVGNDVMSYNGNSQVGAMRSNAPGDVISMLMRVDDRENGGQRASRMSVLTIKEKPSSTEPVTVRCHNGSTDFEESITFLRRSADRLGPPEVSDEKLNSSRVFLNWNVSGEVDHFIVQLNGGAPMLVKSKSNVFFLEQDTNHTIRVQAVDKCGTEGELREKNVHYPSAPRSLQERVEYANTTTPKGNDDVPSRGGRVLAPMLQSFLLAPMIASGFF